MVTPLCVSFDCSFPFKVVAEAALRMLFLVCEFKRVLPKVLSDGCLAIAFDVLLIDTLSTLFLESGLNRVDWVELTPPNEARPFEDVRPTGRRRESLFAVAPLDGRLRESFFLSRVEVCCRLLLRRSVLLYMYVR